MAIKNVYALLSTYYNATFLSFEFRYKVHS